ncbi:hypothetical protein AB0K16_45350 [Nonomuraea jabiensis]|uniref:hypothetical protein n=1 Tax=Nonomuraea jabiensis TaxID=882448 RepID=UPI00343EDAC5
MAKITIHPLLWRMLHETAVRAAEILALNVEDLDLEHRLEIYNVKSASECIFRGRVLGTPGPSSRW